MISPRRTVKRTLLSRFRFYSFLASLVVLAAAQAPAQEIAQAQILDGVSTTAGDLAKGIAAEPSVAQLLAQKTPAAADEGDDDEVDLLEEVKVVSTRRRLTERDTSLTQFSVSREDIEAQGARTMGDALKLSPGFFGVDNQGGTGSDKSTFVRGLDSRRFILLVDGRPTARPSDNRAADVGRLPVNNIERIELITGGAGMRYSADAVTGVINVVTKVPQGPPVLSLGFKAGSNRFAQYSLDYSGSNTLDPDSAGFFAYQLGYERRSAINDYAFSNTVTDPGGGGANIPTSSLIDADPSTPSLDPNPQTGLFNFSPITLKGIVRGLYTFNDSYTGKVIYKPAKEHTLTLSVSQLNTRLGDQFASLNNFGACSIQPNYANSGLSILNCGSNNPNFQPQGKGDQAEDSTTINGVWEWALSPLSTLTTRVSYSSSFTDYPSARATRYVTNRVFDFQSNYSSQITPGNLLNAGFQFTSLRYNSTPNLGVGPGGFDTGVSGTSNDFKLFSVDKETNRWAVYFTEDFKFFDDALVVNVGSRLTDDLLFGTYVTSGTGIRYNFGGQKGSEIFGLRANFTQSVKTPGLSQLYGYANLNTLAGDQNVFTVANPFLKAETGTTYDIGLDVQLSPSMLFRATYFRTDLANALQEGVKVADPKNQSGGLDRNQSTCGLEGTNADCANLNAYSTINAQALLSTGWEFSLDWKIDPTLSLTLSNTIIDTRPVGNAGSDVFVNALNNNQSLNPVLNEGFYYGYPTVDIPFNNTGISLKYDTPSFKAAITGQWVGPRPRSLYGVLSYPPYSRWDLTASVPLNENVTFNAGVFNIFNDRSILADDAILVGGGLVSPPTTFRVGLDATFGGAADARRQEELNSPEAKKREALRSKLRVPLPAALAERLPASPGSSLSSPTAYGASWGSAFVGFGLQSSIRYNPQRPDGALAFGFGLGDAREYAGLEVTTTVLNLISNKNPRNNDPNKTDNGFGSAGILSLKLHHQFGDDIAVAVGMEDVASWGTVDTASSLYGVFTQQLHFPDANGRSKSESDFLSALTYSVGVGGGRFRSIPAINAGTNTVGVFGSVGVRLFEPLSAIADWTGQDLTLGVSYVPFKNLPLVISPAVVDVTSQAVDGRGISSGPRFVIGVGYGFSF